MSWTPSASVEALTLTELIEHRLDPSLSYRTLTTEHFHFHYPDHLSELAASIAANAEVIYHRTTEWFNSEPPTPTHVVLYEKADRPQIFAFIHPHRQIFFDVSLPHFGTGLNDYADWHEWLLTHEFAHVVHMEASGEPYQTAARLLGSWFKPNRLTPRWFKEGVAVRAETELTPHGRGGATFYRAVLRAAAAENKLFDTNYLSPNNFYNERYKTWPWPNRGYILGELLSQKLISRAPPSTLVSEIGESFPTRLTTALQASGFNDTNDLWSQALTGAQQRAERELQEIQQRPLTKLEFLTDDGFWYAGLTISPDGNRLLATRDGPQRGKEIISLTQTEGRWAPPKALLSRTTGYQTSISNSSRFVAFDQSFWHRGNYLLSDIMLYDLKNSAYVSQSRKLRARDPDIHPDGFHLVYVVNEAGKNRLEESNSGFGERRVLIDATSFDRISTPRYSPDGRSIAVGIHNNNAGEDIVLIERASGRRHVLIADGSINRDIAWSPAGDAILYASDRSGVFNIYAHSLKNGTSHQLTNVIGGAHSPALSPDGRWLYLLALRAGGYDIARTKIDQQQVLPITPLAAPPAASKPNPAPPRTYESVGYRPAQYLLPQYVQPQVLFREETTQVGIRLGAVDPLYFHHYELELRRDRDSGTTVGEFFYFNGVNDTAYDVSIIRDVVRIAANDQNKDTTYAEVNADIFLNDRHTFYLRPGLNYQETDFDGESEYYGFNLGLRYNTEFTQLGYSFPETGTFFDLDATYYRGSGDSPSHWRGQLSLETHRPLGKPRHALHGTLSAAWVGDDLANNLVSVGGIARFPLYVKSDIELLGYEPNQFLTKSIAVAGLGYTFPLKDIQFGWFGSRITFGRLSANLRTQAAVMEGERKHAFTIGLELNQDIDLLAQLDLKATLGFYHADDSVGSENRVLFTLTGLPLIKHKARR